MKQSKTNISLILLLSCYLTVSTTEASQFDCQIPASKLNGQTFKSIINPQYDTNRFSGNVTLTIQSDANSIQSLTLKANDSSSIKQEYVYTPLAGQEGLNLSTNFQIQRKLSGDNSNKGFNEVYHIIASCTEQNGILSNLQIKASFSETLQEATTKTGFQYFELTSAIKISSSSWQMLLKVSLLTLLSIILI
ncbi:hypothetical protein ABPG74_007891 [Tetrahymena malaccensis]